jgi:hypothetical protein
MDKLLEIIPQLPGGGIDSVEAPLRVKNPDRPEIGKFVVQRLIVMVCRTDIIVQKI